MNMNKKIFVLLPAFNEEQNLKYLIPKLFNILNKFTEKNKYDFEIVVIDDGSTDNTYFVIKKFQEKFGKERIIIIQHERNLGLGMALKSGITYCLLTTPTEKLDDVVIITMDADGTHDPAYIPEMVKKIYHGYDIVIASRYIRGGAQICVPLFRRILSRIVNYMLKIRFRLPVFDATSGFRAIRGSVLWRVFKRYGENLVKSSEFDAMFEILLKCSRFTDKIIEIPLCLDYSKKSGRSKLRIFRVIVKYLRILFLSPAN